MSTRWTDSPSTIRADEPEQGRALEGIAVPYGVEWDAGNGYRETFAPGAFAQDVERWMSRQDGARLPYLRSHKDSRVFLGPVTQLRDTPEGVWFRAELLDTPDADAHLAEVRAGANGVSVEFAPIGRSPSTRGVTMHRRARLGAIAGALTPAYDMARVSARAEDEGMGTTDLQADEREQPAPDPEPQPEPGPDEPTQLQRRSAERAAIQGTSPARVIRPELVYGPTSEHRFLQDVVLSARGDSGAMERQTRHYAQLDEAAALMARAGDVLSSEIGGAYPTTWMPGLLVERDLKGRPMGGFFQRVAITDARPRVFPKVTTSTTVAAQSGEGVNPALSDFATTPETATPLLYGGGTKVSRQVLDGADPAAEAMVLSDLMESYAQASEAVIVAATEAAAEAGTAAITAATPHDGTLAAIVEYQADRFSPAQAAFGGAAWYTALLTEKATGGAAKVPFISPQNSQGQMQAGAAGASLAGVDIVLSWGSAAGTVVIARSTDMVIYESAVARFSYDQVDGPAAIRLGIWAYLAVADRKSARKHTVA